MVRQAGLTLAQEAAEEAAEEAVAYVPSEGGYAKVPLRVHGVHLCVRVFAPSDLVYLLNTLPPACIPILKTQAC